MSPVRHARESYSMSSCCNSHMLRRVGVRSLEVIVFYIEC